MSRVSAAQPVRRWPWFAAGATVIGLAIRAWALGEQSFSFDELFTLQIVNQPLSAAITIIAQSERTPFLFYAALWPWAQSFGDGELALRFLPMMFGAATVPLIYLAGVRLGSRWAGALAATAYGLAPLAIWYAQEARAYTLVTFLLTVGLVFFADARGARDRAANVRWAIASALAVLTHYFAVFPVVVQAILLVRTRRRAIGWTLIPGLTSLALVPLAYNQAAGHSDPGGVPLLSRLAGLPEELVLGYYASLSIGNTGTVLITTACAAVIGYGIAKASPAFRQMICWLLVMALLGGGISVLIALASPANDFLIARNLLVTAPFFALAVGLCLASIPRPQQTALVLVVLAVLTGGQIWNMANPALERTDWRAAAKRINHGSECGAIIVRPGDRAFELLTYRKDLRQFTDAQRISWIDIVWSPRETPPPTAPTIEADGTTSIDPTVTVRTLDLRSPRLIQAASLAADGQGVLLRCPSHLPNRVPGR